MSLDADTRAALSDLVHRYAAGVDDRQLDDVMDLFADDATLSVPDPPRSLAPTLVHRGRAAIRRAIDAVAAAARTQHAIVGEIYTAAPQEGLAHGRISCIAHHWAVRDEQATDTAWHMRYDDGYVLTATGWRFRSRALTIDAIETRPVRRLRADGA